MRTDISSEHNDMVEKYVAFSEGLKHDTIKNSASKVVKLAEKLEFSEFGLANVEKTFAEVSCGYQFADPNAPFLGNWTAGTLNMLIQEVGSSMEKDTLLNLCFPDKQVPQYVVALDRIAPNTGILPEFGGSNSTLPTIRPLDTYILEYEPGLWGGRIPLNAKDITFARKRGEITLAERGIGQLVAYNTVYGVTQALTRKKYMLNQAIFNNGFTYGGTTIASNIPTGNYIPWSSPMGTLDTATGAVTYFNTDPTYNPFIEITNIVNNPIFLKYQNYIRGIAINIADLRAIMNHPNVKATTNLLMAAGKSLTTKTLQVQIGDVVKELNSYYAPSFDIPLLADGDVWESQNADGTANNDAQNFFIPRGQMFVIMDLTSVGGQLGAFHLTINEVDPNVDTPAMGLFTGVFQRNLSNSDVTNRLDIVAALAGGPAVYMPEAVFVLNGMYENV